MKRFRITLMVPQITEFDGINAQAAHNEATRLASQPTGLFVPATVYSVEQVEEEIGDYNE